MAIANKVCEDYDKSIGGATALDSPKLKEADAVRVLSSALGEKILKFFVYGAVERNILVMYLSHPAMIMEFEGKKEVILEEMRDIYKRENFKEILRFTDVRVAVKPKTAPKRESEEIYEDRAKGDFAIHCKDDVLRRTFERISRTIKEGHSGNSRESL